MGKGDKKSKKGKIWKGSYGNSRPRKSGAKTESAAKPEAK
jgi:30S ribosomal protein S31